MDTATITDSRDDRLVVAELFGPTVQGEGPSLGRQAIFIRTSRCNLACPPCDTPYTWDWSRFNHEAESRSESVDNIVKWALGCSPELVVITGGEPLLQQKAVTKIARHLTDAGRRIEIETNGTIAPNNELVDSVHAFNVSPKLEYFAGQNRQAAHRIRPAALAALMASGKARFKFVVADVAQLDEVSVLVEEHQLSPVWIMPEGTDPTVISQRLTQLADLAIGRGWNVSTRLHVHIWGDKRGK